MTFAGLSSQALVTLFILGAAIFLFLSGRIRADLVALMVLAGLLVTRVLTPQEAFSGFSRSSVITIIALFVLAHALYLTGASGRVGDLLARFGGTGERRLVVLVMSAGAFLSLLMNNIAAASVLLPAVSQTAHRKGIYPSRLLMPLAYATILGGMATLFTTVNIVISGLLRENGLEGFRVFDFAPVGVPVIVAGIAYMALWGRKALPEQSPADRLAAARPPQPDLTEVYRLGERLFRARIPDGSFLDGKTLANSTIREVYNLNVIALEREDRTLLHPPPDTVLRTGDVLVLQGSLEEFREKDVEPYLEILPERSLRESDLESEEIDVAEVVLNPRSSLIGKTLREINFRSKYGFTALAIWRQGRPMRRGTPNIPLEFGDALLIQGPRSRLPILQAEPDLIVMGEEVQRPAAARPRKMGIAAGIVAATLVAAATGLLPTAEAVLVGGLLLVLAGCLTLDEAYAAVEWKSVLLVGGMLSMGLALTKTGAASVAADQIAYWMEPFGPRALLAGMFLLTLLLTQALGGPAVAIITGPLAIQVAQRSGIEPHSLAMAVALAASTAFVSPLGHPVNVLVMGPGGYRFSDYFRVGFPLTILVTIVVLIVLPIFWPLTG